MDIRELLQQTLKDASTRWDERKPGRIFIDLAAEDIPRVVPPLAHSGGIRLITITGTDTSEGIELLYHIADDNSGTVVTLRVILTDRAHPSIESVTPFLKSTQWIEREITELLGVEFRNHPCPAHLLLKDDWPEGNYPLRQGTKNERPE